MAGKRKAATVPLMEPKMDKSSSAADDWAEIMAAGDGESAGGSTAAAATTTTSALTGTCISSGVVGGSAGAANASVVGMTPTKKRPYRRTRRPENYNDKSTITVTTPAAREAPNVYDAVLAEADDLMRAATEAQSLGRLKMASNYLLLLHTRLVGLGKKFDRSKIAKPSMAEESKLKPTRLDMSMEQSELDDAAASSSKQNPATVGSSAVPAATTSCTDNNNNKNPSLKGKEGIPTAAASAAKQQSSPPNPTCISRATASGNRKSNAGMAISEAALYQLTNYLPNNIELDQAMVEHLARAAAELHQKRSGKRSNNDEGLLNSPALNTEEVFHYNKDITANYRDSDGASPISSRQEKWKKVAKEASEGWTEEEETKLKAARRTTSDATRLAQLMGSTRSTQEIIDHVIRLDELEAMEKEMLETPRKRGGRGRKPPTTAMNTVPNANYDAKALLNGSGGGGGSR